MSDAVTYLLTRRWPVCVCVCGSVAFLAWRLGPHLVRAVDAVVCRWPVVTDGMGEAR